MSATENVSKRRLDLLEARIDEFAEQHVDLGMQRCQDKLRTFKCCHSAVGTDESILLLTQRYMLFRGVREYALTHTDNLLASGPAVTVHHNDPEQDWADAFVEAWHKREVELGDPKLVTVEDLAAIRRQVDAKS